MTTNKVQTFTDTRFGNTATIRIDQNRTKPFVLRCRTRYGHMWFTDRYNTAAEAKDTLETLTDPCNLTMPCNWFTVSGFVCDN